MPITEAQLTEKEAVLKKVQTRLNGLLNDDIPNEDQPEILELKKKVQTGLSTIQKMKTELSKITDKVDEPIEQKEMDSSNSPKESTIDENLVNKEEEVPVEYTEDSYSNCNPPEEEEIKEENRLDQKQIGSLLQYLNTDLKKAQRLTKRLKALGQNKVAFDSLVQNRGTDRFKISKELDQLIAEGEDWIVVWKNEIKDFNNSPNTQDNQMDIVLNLKKEFGVFALSAASLLKDSEKKPLIPETIRKKIIQIEKIAKPLRAWLNGLNKAKVAIGSIDSTILLLKELNTAVSLARANNPAAMLKFTAGQLTNRSFSLAASKDWGKVKNLFIEGQAFKECTEELGDELARECLDLLSGKVDPVQELKKLAKLLEEIEKEIKVLKAKGQEI